jgi:hypothetical protein
VLEAPAASTPLGPGLTSWGLAPLVEEPIKALALVALFQFARAEIDGTLDGIVYGALVGFGFSMTENLLFFLNDPQQIAPLFWLRSVFFGLNHAFFTGVVGLALGAARYSPRRMRRVAALGAGLLAAIALHALHNLAVGYSLPGYLLSWLVQSSGILGVLAVAALAWRHEQRWIEEELGEEIALGTISADDYAETLLLQARMRAQMAALLSGNWARFRLVWRLHQAMTRLAFCKYQLRIGDHFRSCDERDELRRMIVSLRKQIARQEGLLFDA